MYCLCAIANLHTVFAFKLTEKKVEGYVVLHLSIFSAYFLK